MLANDGTSLTAQWHFATALANYLHMAMGKTIGFAHQVSQGGLVGTATSTWEDLLGDPTVRMHVVKPVSNVAATDIGGGNVRVSWDAAPGDGQNNGSDPVSGFLGYHIYSADSMDAEFSRLTTVPVTDLEDDLPGNTNQVFMVRAVVLETSNGGTYFNASQGVFSPD